MVASTVTYPHEVVRSHMHIAGSGPFKGFLKTCKQVSPHPVDSQAPNAFHPPGAHPNPTAHVLRRPFLQGPFPGWPDALMGRWAGTAGRMRLLLGWAEGDWKCGGGRLHRASWVRVAIQGMAGLGCVSRWEHPVWLRRRRH